MHLIVLLGRVLYSFVFIISGLAHFSQDAMSYAAAEGVPMVSLLVPLSGVMAIVGGLSILLGFKAKWGAWIVVLFLLPVTLMMHKFWAVQDQMMVSLQQAMFAKNLSMLGGALIIAYFGSGPLSMRR